MSSEFPKVYTPQQVEQRWAAYWVDQRLFVADPHGTGPVFSIVLPPPNVTGSIHIGHMLEHTQIDILVRWRRMSGYRVLWLPGTDHAGIATQVVVERELARQGLSRQQLGREEFERRVWQWKQLYGSRIREQMIRLGASCDWSRERFTLDPPLYRAVLEAFLRLYRDGLIYRGRYMVNWCPRCQTALSDLEVVHTEREGRLWFIRYPLVEGDQALLVATTRPETMLGDTAVAVHPDDDRYRHLIGRRVRLPLVGREIPVIADTAVDPSFGTGAVKVTPAHDPQDFQIAARHGLPEVEVIGPDGRMTEAAGRWAGLDRFEARRQVVEALEAQGLLVKSEPHHHAVGVCDRCKTDVEPRLSLQWFCRMKPLAEPAIEVVQRGLIRIVPDSQRKIYLDWMENIRDWCISRQLWWGHRIPVWHCGDCGGLTPARDSAVTVVDGRAQAASPPSACSACGSPRLSQDPDVLDTWFSSALWPFSTLGWPDRTVDLEVFYPTSLLISGYDILFFWDARMIMMALHLVERERLEDRIPFRVLYLHGLVRDPHGLKMSKTRGNVIDPLEVIEQHGTDALRFALAAGAAPGTDIALSEERIVGYRAFANKIWNAARFLFVNLEQTGRAAALAELAGPGVRAAAPFSTGGRELFDRWIFSRLARVAGDVSRALEEFRFHEAAQSVYQFFWHEFCDWYIEWAKPHLADAGERGRVAWRNLFAAFELALRLLHPFMPFLTEELWQRLPQPEGARSIAFAPFPAPRSDWLDEPAENDVRRLQQIVTAARALRAELKLEPRQRVPAELAVAPDWRSLLDRHREAVLRLAGLAALDLLAGPLPAGRGPVHTAAEFELRLRPPETPPAHVQVELARLRRQAERLAADLENKKRRLHDQTFRQRAPEAVVRQLIETVTQRQMEYEKILTRIEELEAAGGRMPMTGSPQP
jgi:valyl-tRNA synthetase